GYLKRPIGKLPPFRLESGGRSVLRCGVAFLVRIRLDHAASRDH
ncbi:hypothetical protein HMPREF9371_2369, partial [Neisseria shayeganii 871]